MDEVAEDVVEDLVDMPVTVPGGADIGWAAPEAEVRKAEGWKTVGDMVGAAVLPPRKRPDPVDALAVFVAAAHGGGAVLTSDAADIEAYAATLPGADVSAVAV